MADLKYEAVADELEEIFSLRDVRLARQFYRQYYTKEIKNYITPYYDGLRLIALDLRLDYFRQGPFVQFTNNRMLPENQPNKIIKYWKATGMLLWKGNYSRIDHTLELLVRLSALSHG